MPETNILIVGGGIGGLALALTLHQIGVPCTLFESVKSLRPLGVGINLQPNAVRELHDLGISGHDLDRVGLPTREWALVGRNGNEIYSEPRGCLAGYKWPQYSVHRGQLQMLLYEKVLERLGPDVVRLGQRLTGYRNNTDGSVTAFFEAADGSTDEQTGTLLIGADGVHSTVRAQMHPDQPPLHWGGAILWRGTSQARPIRTGASFVGLGTDRQRMIIYPISPPDPVTGLATINWIAEVTVDASDGWQNSDWSKRVSLEDFIHHFESWTFDWLDVPALLRAAGDEVWEYPMVDRDPVDHWVDGAAALLGDAAHVMYPTGSNGAGQAIVDGRVLGACLIEHGVTARALEAYEARLCKPVSELVLRNREAGPFGLLKIVDERCGGLFDDIDEVIAPADRAAFVAGYKEAAGFAIEELNGAAPTIAPGVKVA